MIFRCVCVCRLHPNNVLGIRAFSDQMMCSNLVDACNKYIQKHFVDVSKSEEFLNLSKKEILDVISLDELHVTSEEQVGIFLLTVLLIL